MIPEKNIESRLEQLAQAISSGDSFVRGVMSRLETSSDTVQKQKPTFVRRFLMKPFTKFAAAAAVLIVIAVVSSQLMFVQPTFADVVRPLLNSRTLAYDVIRGPEDDGMVTHDIVVGSRMRRTLPNIGGITRILIIDIDKNQMLMLETERKTASYQEMKGVFQHGAQGFMDFLRTAIRKAQENIESSPRNLGTRQIDGKTAVGYQLGDGGDESVIIWADTKTALLIRIEAEFGPQRVTLKNFQFDIPVDPALVSMDVPAGYTLTEAAMDMTDLTEEDFIAGLKIWAEILLDGRFPESITTDQCMKQAPLLRDAVIRRKMPQAEAEQIRKHFVRGMMFIAMFDGQWHYAGNGVKLGDAATPIFWYRPKDAQDYRVIYGDLSVAEMTDEDLRTIIKSKPESKTP